MFNTIIPRCVPLLRSRAIEFLNHSTVKSSPFNQNVTKLCKSTQASGLTFFRPFTTVPGHGSPTSGKGSPAVSSAPAGASAGGAGYGYAASTRDDIDVGVYDEPPKWADFRDLPGICRVNARRNADGDLEGVYKGVTCIFPDQEVTLEWVLSTPVDVHLFEEQPYVKDCPDDDEFFHQSHEDGLDDPDNLLGQTDSRKNQQQATSKAQ